MTTIVQFQPTISQPFQFNPVLDGTSYVATCPWSLTGQRFYLKITTQNGQLIVNRSLVGSPLTYDIDLLVGLGFASTLVLRESTLAFEVTP